MPRGWAGARGWCQQGEMWVHPRHGSGRGCALSPADRQVPPAAAQLLRASAGPSSASRGSQPACEASLPAGLGREVWAGVCQVSSQRGTIAQPGVASHYFTFLASVAGPSCVCKPPVPPAPSTAPVSGLATGSLPSRTALGTGDSWPLPSRGSEPRAGGSVPSSLPGLDFLSAVSNPPGWTPSSPLAAPLWGSPTVCVHQDLTAPVLWGTWQGQPAPKGGRAGTEQV